LDQTELEFFVFTEFVSRDLDIWAYSRSVTLDFSRPGKPTDNALIESFNDKFRAQCSEFPLVHVPEQCARELRGTELLPVATFVPSLASPWRNWNYLSILQIKRFYFSNEPLCHALGLGLIIQITTSDPKR
jgi:transposase InsO family protein